MIVDCDLSAYCHCCSAEVNVSRRQHTNECHMSPCDNEQCHMCDNELSLMQQFADLDLHLTDPSHSHQIYIKVDIYDQ